LDNNVEATFDIVEATFDIVAFDNVASTLLLVWTGLKATDDKTSITAAKLKTFERKLTELHVYCKNWV